MLGVLAGKPPPPVTSAFFVSALGCFCCVVLRALRNFNVVTTGASFFVVAYCSVLLCKYGVFDGSCPPLLDCSNARPRALTLF